MENQEYTLKEASKLLNLSIQTIKRRIERGEIQARKENTESGERWLIPSSQFLSGESVKENLPASKLISIQELQQAFSMVAAAQTQEIKEYISQLEGKLDRQSQVLERQSLMLDGHYRLVDQRLRELHEKKQEDAKPFWKRFF
ncbi:hypothetical protein P22_2687 [Propionispora sp. 2/2-37]|uniref:helix-turn-helix domain-containing protein n=1 Tax=Propionispora sp. 2/2-37 TaxID=1677858 RepID=UPI0006BB98F7|nr:helix-turn-helix domain-containing protein [Propionispora sp. 2/2-37]CUH96597.1 hypothetical protein P22_2687 [Propionispora sp. 2/2-37]